MLLQTGDSPDHSFDGKYVRLCQRDLSSNLDSKAGHSGMVEVEKPHSESFSPNRLCSCLVSIGLSSTTRMFLEYFLLSELLRKKEAAAASIS